MAGQKWNLTEALVSDAYRMKQAICVSKLISVCFYCIGSSALEYETAIAQREIKCIEQLPVAKSMRSFDLPIYYMPSKENKLLAARSFLEVLGRKVIFPKDPTLSEARIWHNDLKYEHIYVDRKYPEQIRGILDWRYTEIAPFYIHTLTPEFTEYRYTPKWRLMDRSDKKDIRSLHSGEKDANMKSRKVGVDYMRARLVSRFRRMIWKTYPRWFAAMEFQQGDMGKHHDLMELAHNLFVDGETTFLNSLARRWRLKKRDVFGLQTGGKLSTELYRTISDASSQKIIRKNRENYAVGLNRVRDVKDAVGKHHFDNQGLIRYEDYYEARRTLNARKSLFMKKHHESPVSQLGHAWPFH